ncbi:class I SAM-dependent methyltransferase [Dokdonella immobilis]|uniref:Methyltransferase domain-containing protein n=1 Tax=Dokdonella immobilis TaxID=578942 RepID=A0A1I4WTN5_9GAMM|nr:class I SAM-dependent methyltransferase [Dokdonella immobilis]SFN17178.1 Methyltransferase domain-containing protein [Dokdonella immobilis]
MIERDDTLEFTGERFTPECVREIWCEHWHRYAFAMPLCRGQRVLDAACGEGYGSDLIARVASEVVGVDISEAAVCHARKRYGSRENLQFAAGDASALTFDDGCFDVVVSFETLEHLDAQDRLVAGFARVLREDGLLLISSPDKRTYSEVAGFRNEFHVRELYREELLELLGRHFPHVRLYAQKLLFQSALWSLDGSGQGSLVQTASADGSSIEDGFAYAPLYYVAACSRQPLPAVLPTTAWFGDREEAVYTHYNGEVRKNMKAGARIAELEAEILRLRQSTVPRPPSRWLRWLRR